MKKIITMTMLALLTLTCTSKFESYKFLDEEHKSFYVNGVSAMDGHEAIIKGLESIGFEMGDVTTCDLSYIGKGVTYYTVLKSTRPFTQQEFNCLTNGLFINLPTGDFILQEVNNKGCRVYLSWYRSGIVNQATIQISRYGIKEDAIEVNKRLATLFPHSRIGNSAGGYMIYYTDYGVEVFYTNDYVISIEKK